MNDVTIGTYSMQTDFDLYLPDYVIPSPAPQTKFVQIIGRDGAVDLSEALGGIHYDSRKWTLDFKCFDPTVNWNTLSSSVMNAIHGKRLNFSFESDPDYFWTGRFNVESYKSARGEGTIRMSITADPYKYKKLATVVTDTVPKGTSYTGSLVTVDASNGKKITSWTGDTIRRTGKNLCRVAIGWSGTSGVTYTENADGTVHCKGTATADTFSAAPATTVAGRDERCLYTVPSGTYTISNISGVRLWANFRNAANTDNVETATSVAVGASKTFTFSEPTIIYVRAYIASGTSVDADMQVMVTQGSTAATVYDPWKMGEYTTGQIVPTLNGTNNLWSDDVSVTVFLSSPIVLANTSKPVVPTVTTSSPMTLYWGNYTYSAQAGTFIVPQLILGQGANYVCASGTGTISFSYSEGSL